MSQEDIKRMEREIKIRYHQIEIEKMKELEKYHGKGYPIQILRDYANSIYRQMHNAIVQEIGEFIIAPYQDDPKKIIARFFFWFGKQYVFGYRNDLLPELDDFMEWYCNSDVICTEVYNERMNIKDDPRYLPQ